jgi:DnaK suppressor protein
MTKEQSEIRERLLARQRDLEQSLNRLEANALDSGAADVLDEMDQVIVSEAKTVSFDLNTREYASLRDVRAALVRLDDGTYGTCVICGNPIEPARLQAIPETPYCREHAEAQETQTVSATM